MPRKKVESCKAQTPKTVTPKVSPSKAPKRAKAAKSPKPTLTPAEALQALMHDEFPLVEQAIRQFQDKAKAINTDAAYEVKAACDYFVRDVTGGILTNLLSEMEAPEYRPDEFAAAVLDGDVEDVPLIGSEPIFKGTTVIDKRFKAPVMDAVEVPTTGPVKPRSQAKTAQGKTQPKNQGAKERI